MRIRITSKITPLEYLKSKVLFSQLQKRGNYFRQEQSSVKAIFANDLIGHEISVNGTYEKNQLDTLFAFLKPLMPLFAKTTALDIGANIGNHSHYFSRIFSKVIAFEPSSTIFRLLEINTEDLANVRIEKLALGSENSESTLYSNTSNYGSSSIIKDHDAFQMQEKINIKLLDDINLGTNSVSLMKIDVEGFEIEVLRGAIDTIISHQPLILLEQWEHEIVNNTSISLSFLNDLGYRFVWTEENSWGRNPLSRRFGKLIWMILGEKHTFFTSAANIPTKYHSLIIAIPIRFLEQLGVTD